jgi:hypothetical protein
MSDHDHRGEYAEDRQADYDQADEDLGRAEAWFSEPFGPIYERPPGVPCPECECCTLRLCQVAARKDTPCAHQSDDPQAVAGCPCASTPWRTAREGFLP